MRLTSSFRRSESLAKPHASDQPFGKNLVEDALVYQDPWAIRAIALYGGGDARSTPAQSALVRFLSVSWTPFNNGARNR